MRGTSGSPLTTWTAKSSSPRTRSWDSPPWAHRSTATVARACRTCAMAANANCGAAAVFSLPRRMAWRVSPRQPGGTDGQPAHAIGSSQPDSATLLQSVRRFRSGGFESRPSPPSSSRDSVKVSPLGAATPCGLDACAESDCMWPCPLRMPCTARRAPDVSPVSVGLIVRPPVTDRFLTMEGRIPPCLGLAPSAFEIQV
jgi:hypothetical protein